MAVYRIAKDSLFLTELPMYGEKRFGVIKENRFLMKKPTQNGIATPVIVTASIPPVKTSIYPLGKKHYETTDRLGNVRVTYTDKKSWQQNKFSLNVSSSQDYYPFGAIMEGRKYNLTAYRYAFNTQERIPELNESHYMALYWEYDGRLARRWNRDPKPTVGESEYAVNKNNPIQNNDPDGDCPICLLADAAVDIAFVAYDLGEMAYDYITKGKIDPVSYVALTADVASIAVPFSTGAGLAARTMYKAAGHTLERGMLKGMTQVFKAANVERVVIREGKAGAGMVVIGENMSRVTQVANKLKAETFDVWEAYAKKYGKEAAEKRKAEVMGNPTEAEKFWGPEGEAMQLNKEWIEQAKKEGKTIVDIGLDPKRTKRSDFYKMESETTKNYGKKSEYTIN